MNQFKLINYVPATITTTIVFAALLAVSYSIDTSMALAGGRPFQIERNQPAPDKKMDNEDTFSIEEEAQIYRDLIAGLEKKQLQVVHKLLMKNVRRKLKLTVSQEKEIAGVIRKQQERMKALDSEDCADLLAKTEELLLRRNRELLGVLTDEQRNELFALGYNVKTVKKGSPFRLIPNAIWVDPRFLEEVRRIA